MPAKTLCIWRTNFSHKYIRPNIHLYMLSSMFCSYVSCQAPQFKNILVKNVWCNYYLNIWITTLFDLFIFSSLMEKAFSKFQNDMPEFIWLKLSSGVAWDIVFTHGLLAKKNKKHCSSKTLSPLINYFNQTFMQLWMKIGM